MGHQSNVLSAISVAVVLCAAPVWAQQDAAPVVPTQPITTPEGTSPDAAPMVAQGVEDVIARQLRAFKARDIDEAWRFASPGIQGMFGSADNFGAMVSQGYPMVWDNSDVRFLKREQISRWQVQTIMVQDALGALHMLEYRMIETPDGWRVDGVSLLPAPDVGA